MLKAAVIGCGRMGAEPSARLDGKVPAGWSPISHVEAFNLANGVELVALSETNLERLQWAGRRYQVERLYVDYCEMLAEIAPDVLGIATRTPAKLEILREACRRGVKGVYVEKPLANSLRGARSILDEAQRANMVVSYGVNRRYHSVYRQARDLIRNGEIGELLEIVIEFGESQLLWTHPHAVDLMLFLSGQRPVDVRAELLADSVVQSAAAVVDSDPVVSYAQFAFDGGVRGLIVRGGGCNVRVNGTRGALEIVSDGATLVVRKSTAALPGYFLAHQTLFPVANCSATVVAIQELIANVDGRSVPSISSDEIYLGMQMLLGCVYSHLQGGRTCALADVPADLEITGRTGHLYA